LLVALLPTISLPVYCYESFYAIQEYKASETQFFLWLFMLMNWCYGAGYLIFSGIANVGDWAVVIHGWEPIWLLRILMIVVGTLIFMFFVRLAL